MHWLVFLGFTLVVILAGFALCGATIVWTHRRLAKGPAEAARTMPLPSTAAGPGASADVAARALEDQARLEKRLVLLLRERSGETAYAAEIAAHLGEDVDQVAAVLAALGERIPHQVRVTASGRLLYDFSPRLVAQYRSPSTLPPVQRLLAFLAMLLGGLGTAWPALFAVIFMLVWIFGGEGIFSGLLLGATFFYLGWFLVFAALLVLVPGLELVRSVVGRRGCKPGELHADAITSSIEAKSTSSKDLIEVVFGFLGHMVETSLDAVGQIIQSLEDLWVASGQLETPDQHIAPADWAAHDHRYADPAAKAARGLIEEANVPPKHVARIGRGILYAARTPRFDDPGMTSRLAAQAAGAGGRVSSLDISLAEGLSTDDAVAAGASLIRGAGGDIAVSDAGDVVFVVPGASGATPAGPIGETLTIGPDGDARARFVGGVRSTVPGITWVEAGDAAIAVCGSMAILILVALLSIGDDPVLATVGDFIQLGFLVGSLLAGFVLVGVGSSVIEAAGVTAIWRDVRRVTGARVRALAAGTDAIFDPAPFADELAGVLRELWPDLPAEGVHDSVRRYCDDIGLEPDASQAAYPLAPVRERLAAVAAVGVVTHAEAPVSFAEDPIIFSSHDPPA